MSTIFEKIIAREIPAFIIDEDEFHIAFLDVNPLKEGHTLVIPKKPIDYIFDIENDDLSALVIFAKKVASKLKSKIDCTKIGMTVIGLEVPHAHIHLIPIDSISDMNFNGPKLSITKERLLEIQKLLIN
jgi:histidine triad (HIT) family protein